NKKVESDASHAPGVAVADGIAVDLRRVQVEEHVREHAQSAIARRVVVFVPEDRGVDLSLGRVFEVLNLLFGFGGDVGLERVDVFLDARFYPLQETDSDTVAVFSVFVFFSPRVPLYVGTAALG